MPSPLILYGAKKVQRLAITILSLALEQIFTAHAQLVI